MNKLRRSPLQLPINSAEFLRTFVFDRPPTSDDFKAFKISDLWIHRSPSSTPPYGYFVLVDKPSQSAVWLDIGGSQSGDIQFITGNTGGPIPPDGNSNLNLLGANGISTSGSGNDITITTSSSGFGWTVDTTTPISVNIGEGHISNGGAQIVYNLPSTASVGDGFAFMDLLGNGFQINAAASQTIRVGNQITSVAGSITSTAAGDAIFLVCGVEDLTFLSYAIQGNLTLI